MLLCVRCARAMQHWRDHRHAHARWNGRICAQSFAARFSAFLSRLRIIPWPSWMARSHGAVARPHATLAVRRPAGHRYRRQGAHAINRWRVNDLYLRHRMIMDGLGWGTMPGHLVAEDLKAGRLVVLPLDPSDPATGCFRTDLQRRASGVEAARPRGTMARIASGGGRGCSRH